MERCKKFAWFLFTRPPKLLNKILTTSPWECVIKVCSNSGTTFILGEIIAKENLNVANLMKPLKIFFS